MANHADNQDALVHYLRDQDHRGRVEALLAILRALKRAGFVHTGWRTEPWRKAFRRGARLRQRA